MLCCRKGKGPTSIQVKMSFQDIQNGAKGASSSSRNPSQGVAAGIFQINTAVAAFRRLVDVIGTAKDTPDHRTKLHSTRQRILQLVKETSAKLKSLSESDRDSDVNTSKKIEDAKLARDFQSTLQEFQRCQQLASERESMYSPVAVESSSPVQEEKVPFLKEQKEEVILLENEIGFNEGMIEERDQGIREVEQQIGQANEIFKDLAVLVHDQGVVIDDISSNVDTSSNAANQGRDQILKASRSVKSKYSWCWWVLGVLVVVIVVFLVILLIL